MVQIRTLLLAIGFLLSAAATLAILAGWVPAAWLVERWGGMAVYPVAALTILLAFLLMENWNRSG